MKLLRKAVSALLVPVVVLKRFSLVFRQIDEETFLAIVVLPDGNLGKARYLMRRHLLALREEL